MSFIVFGKALEPTYSVSVGITLSLLKHSEQDVYLSLLFSED